METGRFVYEAPKCPFWANPSAPNFLQEAAPRQQAEKKNNGRKSGASKITLEVDKTRQRRVLQTDSVGNRQTDTHTEAELETRFQCTVAKTCTCPPALCEFLNWEDMASVHQEDDQMKMLCEVFVCLSQCCPSYLCFDLRVDCRRV